MLHSKKKKQRLHFLVCFKFSTHLDYIVLAQMNKLNRIHMHITKTCISSNITKVGQHSKSFTGIKTGDKIDKRYGYLSSSVSKRLSILSPALIAKKD